MIIFFLIYLFLCIFITCFLHLLGACRGLSFALIRDIVVPENLIYPYWKHAVIILPAHLVTDLGRKLAEIKTEINF